MVGQVLGVMEVVMVVARGQGALPYNKSPKPAQESSAALRGLVSGCAAWLKR